MTDQYILSIDPGKSSGIALLAYNDQEAWLEGSWQFSGGVNGLLHWTDQHLTLAVHDLEKEEGVNWIGRKGWPEWVKFTPISEKFTARNTQGFSYTTDSLEPLRGEGALIALGLMPDYSPTEKRWRDPKLQYLVGGKDKADKKKREHKFLKDSGFYVAPLALGTTDADDFRSACAHGLAYLQRELKHRGVHAMVSEWMENN